jgi:hypothetical protein
VERHPAPGLLGVVLSLGFRAFENRVLAWYYGLRRARRGASQGGRAMSVAVEVCGLCMVHTRLRGHVHTQISRPSGTRARRPPRAPGRPP